MTRQEVMETIGGLLLMSAATSLIWLPILLIIYAFIVGPQ